MPDAECLKIISEIVKDLNLGDFIIKVNNYYLQIELRLLFRNRILLL